MFVLCKDYMVQLSIQQNSENFQTSAERTVGTYTTNSSLDDKVDDLHYYTSYIKFGLGRVHYDVAQEIRMGDITYEEGKELISKYNGEYPIYDWCFPFKEGDALKDDRKCACEEDTNKGNPLEFI